MFLSFSVHLPLSLSLSFFASARAHRVSSMTNNNRWMRIRLVRCLRARVQIREKNEMRKKEKEHAACVLTGWEGGGKGETVRKYRAPLKSRYYRPRGGNTSDVPLLPSAARINDFYASCGSRYRA